MQSELEMSVYYDQDNPKTTTARIRKSIVQVLQELHIAEKIQAAAEDAHQAADDAHKAWQTAQRIEKRELRSKAAAAASYKMEIE